MTSYHLLLLDDEHAVRTAQSLSCEDDAHAIANALVFIGGRNAELWEGNRLVQRFEPTRQ